MADMSSESHHRRYRSNSIEDENEHRQHKRCRQTWAVCLSGCTEEEGRTTLSAMEAWAAATTLSTMEAWAVALLKDHDLLEQEHGHPVTRCCYVRELPEAVYDLDNHDIYMEFRCAVEHGRFLSLGEMPFTDGNTITIRNWLTVTDSSTHAFALEKKIAATNQPAALEPEPESSEMMDSSTHAFAFEEQILAQKHHAAAKRLPYGTRIASEVMVQLVLPEGYRNIISTVNDLQRLMRRHKIVNEGAILGWMPGGTGKPVFPKTQMYFLLTESPEAADKICLCNGVVIKKRGTGFMSCLMLRRPNRMYQVPMDWYANYWVLKQKPAPNCGPLVRVTITRQDDSTSRPWLTPLRLQAMLNSAGALQAMLNSATLFEEARCKVVAWVWPSTRTDYDYLIQASSPEAAKALTVLRSTGDKEFRFSWSLCTRKPDEQKPCLEKPEGITDRFASAANSRSSIPITNDANLGSPPTRPNLLTPATTTEENMLIEEAIDSIKAEEDVQSVKQLLQETEGDINQPITGGNTATIRNWRVESSMTKASAPEPGEMTDSPSHSLAFENKKSARRHYAIKKLPDGTRIDSKVRVYLLLPKREEGIVEIVNFLLRLTMEQGLLTEDAILGWMPGSGGSPIPNTRTYLLQTKSPTAATKICWGNGYLRRVVKTGPPLCLVLRRPKSVEQMPHDWYSYYWVRHNMAAPDCRSLVRATIKKSGANVPPSKLPSPVSLRKMLNEARMSVVFGGRIVEWVWHSDRTDYDYLIQASSSKTAEALLLINSCDELTDRGYHSIVWSLCRRRKSRCTGRSEPAKDHHASISTSRSNVSVDATPVVTGMRPSSQEETETTAAEKNLIQDPIASEKAEETVQLLKAPNLETEGDGGSQQNPCCSLLQQANDRLVTENQAHREQAKKFAAKVTEQKDTIKSLYSDLADRDKQNRDVVESLTLLTKQQAEDRKSLQEMKDYVAAEMTQHRATKRQLQELQANLAQSGVKREPAA